MNRNKWKCTECKSAKANATSNRGASPAPMNLESASHTSILNVDSAALTTYLDNKFESLRNDWKSDITAALANMHVQIKAAVSSEVKAAIESLKEDFSATTDFLAAEQSDCKTEIVVTNKKLAEFENNYTQLQLEMRKLEQRLMSAEKQSRSLNLEIHAVPEKNNENVVKIFRDLCDIINAPITDPEIRACRRIAKLDSSSARPRTILVTLPSERHRDTIISAMKRYRKDNPSAPIGSRLLGVPGDDQLVFVAEHLSPEMKDLHATARKFGKAHKYQFVWVKYGKIYIRKDINSPHILIKDKNVLSKLANC